MINEPDLFIGIDIGGTNTVIGLVELSGKEVKQEIIPTPGGDFYLFFEKVSRILDVFFCDFVNIKGIGIGAPSANPHTGCVDNPINLRWGLVEIVKHFQEKYPVVIKLINDANAAALGEMSFGKASDWHTFIHVTLGTGLGSSIIIDKKVVNGKDGFAGELGHTKISDRHRRCICGHMGCLETYVSANGIRRTVYELLAAHQDESSLRSINYNELDSRLISEHAHKGDHIALKAFEITGKILGDKLADVFALFNPQGVILSGGMIAAGDILINPVRNALMDSLLDIHKRKIEVRVSGVERNIAVLGAACLVMNQ